MDALRCLDRRAGKDCTIGLPDQMHTLRGADETEGSVQRSPEPQDWIYQWHLKLVLSRRYLMITAKTDTCISFISKGVLNDFYLRFCVVKTNSGCNR
jgi:hypothetical protein